ncbi:MAG: S1/P1 nuclease [Erythrobacter sp.]
MMRILALLLFLLTSSPALAWGAFGHETTADIAEANISANARAKIARLIAADKALGTPECRIRNLKDASTWPDCVRRTRWRWGYTAAWHYRTTPICEAYNPRSRCSGGNCVTAQITRSQRLLADETLPVHIRLEALAFMVHFAGDIHMPLHSGDKDDRGGNDRRADYGIVPDMNLHWIWDGPLAERAITTGSRPTVRSYVGAERAELSGGTPEDWGRESWQLAREVVYPLAFDTDPCASELPMITQLSQEDIQIMLPHAKRRVQQAGLRIADMIEVAFQPGPLPIEVRTR